MTESSESNSGTDQTESQSGKGQFARVEHASVRVLVGVDRAQWIGVGPSEVVIGTDDDCDLVLGDRKVSKRHLAIKLGTRGFLVRDLQSRNGTYFQGIRVGEIAVPPATTLTIGDTQIFLQATTKEECSVDRAFSFQREKQSLIQRFEREFLQNALAASEGNIRQTARTTGLERTQLKRLLNKHGLR